MTAEELRAKVLADLEALGFHAAKWLPPPEVNQPIRAPADVASRLMALKALFIWVALPEQAAPSEQIEEYLDRNGLRAWLASDEREMIALPRDAAHESHVNRIGWKLENMWALAWVLGFDPEPDLEASQIRERCHAANDVRVRSGRPCCLGRRAAGQSDSARGR